LNKLAAGPADRLRRDVVEKVKPLEHVGTETSLDYLTTAAENPDPAAAAAKQAPRKSSRSVSSRLG
jgi:hypothetical protein